MADELEITTLNENEDGNVDNVPGLVSTGYQAQNTLAESARSGMDTVTVEEVGGGVTAKLGGTVDVSGILYTLKEDIVFSPSTTDGNYYFVVVDSADLQFKTIELQDVEPVWDAEKNAYYTASGNRILDKYITVVDSVFKIYKLELYRQEFDDLVEETKYSPKFATCKILPLKFDGTIHTEYSPATCQLFKVGSIVTGVFDMGIYADSDISTKAFAVVDDDDNIANFPDGFRPINVNIPLDDKVEGTLSQVAWDYLVGGSYGGHSTKRAWLSPTKAGGGAVDGFTVVDINASGEHVYATIVGSKLGMVSASWFGS